MIDLGPPSRPIIQSMLVRSAIDGSIGGLFSWPGRLGRVAFRVSRRCDRMHNFQCVPKISRPGE